RQQIPYVAALGKDPDGKVRAVTDNSSPGGFWYRRDLAEKYVGTGDPPSVSGKVSDWDQIIDLGKRVAKDSGGKVHLLASYTDVIMVNQYWTKPWVQDNRLQIDPEWNDILDTARKIRAEGVDAKLDAFSPAWGAAWNNASVVMFAWPSWAEMQIDKAKTSGLWGIAKSPRGYYSGGTYRAIYKGSKKKQRAYDFIEYLSGPEWQTWNLENTQNMPALKTLFRSEAPTYRPPLLDKQPVLDTYYPIAMQIPARTADKYSESVLTLFNSVVADMIRQGDSNDDAFENLKSQVKDTFPELEV
ncbi:MAG TPA: extracellular solute-binding protein, partial [Mycobacteriales bacterium]|nr:extracellular solute-binding protein [Mycobacteriales bacterium]